jgi:transcriptional regulator with XRE-family HTH domain
MALNRDKIVSLYKKKGWTMEILSEESGVSRQAIIAITSGRSDPQIGTVEKLAKSLDVTIGFLLDETDLVPKTVKELEKKIADQEKIIESQEFLIKSFRELTEQLKIR